MFKNAKLLSTERIFRFRQKDSRRLGQSRKLLRYFFYNFSNFEIQNIKNLRFLKNCLIRLAENKGTSQFLIIVLLFLLLTPIIKTLKIDREDLPILIFYINAFIIILR